MPPPRKRSTRPRVPGSESRAGAVQRLETSAAAYHWPCPHCACTRNLQVLGREVCSNCLHRHTNPEEKPTDAA
jgi:hypothetical protein